MPQSSLIRIPHVMWTCMHSLLHYHKWALGGCSGFALQLSRFEILKRVFSSNIFMAPPTPLFYFSFLSFPVMCYIIYWWLVVCRNRVFYMLRWWRRGLCFLCSVNFFFFFPPSSFNDARATVSWSYMDDDGCSKPFTPQKLWLTIDPRNLWWNGFQQGIIKEVRGEGDKGER